MQAEIMGLIKSLGQAWSIIEQQRARIEELEAEKAKRAEE